MDRAIRVRQRLAANDRIRELSYADSDEPIEFFCECGDGDCRRPVWLSPGAFDRARKLGRPLLAEHAGRRLVASA